MVLADVVRGLMHALLTWYIFNVCKDSIIRVFSTDGWNIDYVEVVRGSSVILIQNSVSGNQQWRPLTEAL